MTVDLGKETRHLSSGCEPIVPEPISLHFMSSRNLVSSSSFAIGLIAFRSSENLKNATSFSSPCRNVTNSEHRRDTRHGCPMLVLAIFVDVWWTASNLRSTILRAVRLALELPRIGLSHPWICRMQAPVNKTSDSQALSLGPADPQWGGLCTHDGSLSAQRM